MTAATTLRDAIQSRLKSGQWPPGHRIPTERELGEQFGVSRTTVRRVLADFKDQKLITPTVGSGTYVSDDIGTLLANNAANLHLDAISPAELMEARLVLEPAIVEMVVANATVSDFTRMATCCERAEAAGTLEEFEYWDGMLHEVIAEAAHNGFMLNVFRLMNQVRARAEWGLLKKRSVTPERRLAYEKEHRSIVQAMRERDAQTAKEATRAHLAHVRRNMVGY
jgi:DNA-binding FadR family transcriptional regulator